QGVDKRFPIHRQHRVPATLERDCARRLSAESRTTHGSREMSRINLNVAGQWKKRVVNARVQQGSVFTRSSRQIWSAHRPDEQRVTCQEEPRIRSPPKIRPEKADAFRRMSGSVQHAQTRVPELHLLGVAQPREWE